MKRFVVVLTVWAMGLVGAAGSVMLPAGPASAALPTATGALRAATVSAGASHSCALTSTGGVKCWGNNDYGQLGNGNNTSSSNPVDVSGLSGVVALSVGGFHSCAVTTVGGVRCWGNNEYGELGDGTTNNSSVPVAVSGLASGVASVSATNRPFMGGTPETKYSQHTCAVTTTGAALCWGANFFGELGDGTTDDSSVPVPVTGLGSGVAAVSAGGSHTCAVTTGGAAKCWGFNLDGELGNNSTTDSPVPVDVSGLGSGVASVSAGYAHSCVVTSTGAAKCWGWNMGGELGNNTATDSGVPVDVVGLGSGVATVSSGWHHTCARTTAGAVKCWGMNASGDLGNGTLQDSLVPVGVYGLGSGMAEVSAGGFHSCAAATAGAVKCWGINNHNELGDGTTSGTTVPVYVIGFGVAEITRLSDFNSDGYTDLVARDAAGLLWLYMGNGAGGFLGRRQMGSGWNIMRPIITPGDVNGDGAADILGRDAAGRLWLYPGNGVGGLRTRRQIGSGWNIMNAITNAADLNGAGRPDLLARDTAGMLWLYPISGNAVIGARVRIGFGWQSVTAILAPGDFSGDGRPDILARDSAGVLRLYRGTGTGGVTAGTVVSSGWAGMNALVTPGNWERAAGNDVLARDPAGKLWRYPGNDNGGLGARIQTGSGWQSMTYIG